MQVETYLVISEKISRMWRYDKSQTAPKFFRNVDVNWMNVKKHEIMYAYLRINDCVWRESCVMVFTIITFIRE
jgi:hypothetical protein